MTQRTSSRRAATDEAIMVLIGAGWDPDGIALLFRIPWVKVERAVRSDFRAYLNDGSPVRRDRQARWIVVA